jgi:hypothetical protein
MNEFGIYKQMQANNNQAVCKFLSTGAHTFSASSTGAAYRIVGLTNWRAKSMTNPMWISAAALSSVTTMVAGTEITGKITAITIVAGRAVAYLAREPFFIQ